MRNKLLHRKKQNGLSWKQGRRHCRKEWEHQGKGNKTKMTTDSDTILVDTEKEVTGWNEDQRRVRSRSEEERSERNLHSASPILVMLRAGERCLWCCLKTATKFLQALGFLLPPASFLRRTSFWRCLTGKRRAMQGDPERENSYTAWDVHCHCLNTPKRQPETCKSSLSNEK